jgi:hypothetical protein
MKLEIVVNIFAGPGAGKSVLASDLFSALKKEHYHTEIISEYAKELTWEERINILTSDQFYIFAKQHRRLLRIKDKIDIAICESPLIMSMMYYNEKLELIDKKLYDAVVFDAHNKYPNLNFFLERDIDLPYQQIGRNQTLEEALIIDESIKNMLKSNKIQYTNLKVKYALSGVMFEIHKLANLEYPFIE